MTKRDEFADSITRLVQEVGLHGGDLLEGNNMKTYIHAVFVPLSIYDAQAARIAALTEQRDAALEACRVLQEEVLTLQRAVGVGDGPRMHEADALIAKAKEVTP